MSLGSWWTREKNGKIYFSSHNDKFCNIFCIRNPWKTTWLHARDTNSLDMEYYDNCFGASPLTFGFTSNWLMAIWNTAIIWENISQNLIFFHTCFFLADKKEKQWRKTHEKIKWAKAVLSPGMGSLVFSICQEDLAGAGGSFDKLHLKKWRKNIEGNFFGVPESWLVEKVNTYT